MDLNKKLFYELQLLNAYLTYICNNEFEYLDFDPIIEQY